MGIVFFSSLPSQAFLNPRHRKFQNNQCMDLNGLIPKTRELFLLFFLVIASVAFADSGRLIVREVAPPAIEDALLQTAMADGISSRTIHGVIKSYDRLVDDLKANGVPNAPSSSMNQCNVS